MIDWQNAARLHRINPAIVSGILGDAEVEHEELPANSVVYTSADDLRNRVHSTPHVLFCTIKRGQRWLTHCVRPRAELDGSILAGHLSRALSGPLPITFPHLSLIVFDEQDNPMMHELIAQSSSTLAPPSSMGTFPVDSQDARAGKSVRVSRSNGTTEVVDLMLKLSSMLQEGKSKQHQVRVTFACVMRDASR